MFGPSQVQSGLSELSFIESWPMMALPGSEVMAVEEIDVKALHGPGSCEVEVIVIEEDSQQMDSDADMMEAQHQSPCIAFKSHFAEIYSPVRVARFIQHFGLSCCGSFDIVNGFDFCSCLFTFSKDFL